MGFGRVRQRDSGPMTGFRGGRFYRSIAENLYAVLPARSGKPLRGLPKQLPFFILFHHLQAPEF